MATPKVWFITGCSSGFGEELALGALKRGDNVIASARNPDKLDIVRAAGAAACVWDVTSPLEDLKKAAAEAHKIYGKFDYLINNAGYNQVGGLEELRYDPLRESLSGHRLISAAPRRPRRNSQPMSLAC